MSQSTDPGLTTATPEADVSAAPRRADASDVPDLTRTLSEAFFDDPVFMWWIADPERRQAILPPTFKILVEATLPAEHVYIGGDSSAGAVWLPPGGDDDDDEMASALGEVAEEYAERLQQLTELLDRHHPSDPHYYLFFLATRLAWQGQGLGSAMMRPVLEICDRDGVPAYLEATAERNRDLYLRHGFRVTEELRLPDGPPVWRMWRDPS